MIVDTRHAFSQCFPMTEHKNPCVTSQCCQKHPYTDILAAEFSYICKLVQINKLEANKK